MPTFAASAEAFDLAKRNARFGHKDWLVWLAVDGWHAERLAVETLTTAVEAKGGKIVHVTANDATGINVGPGLAQIMLRNLRGGK